MKCYCSSFEIKHIERFDSCLFDLLYTIVLDILIRDFLYMSRKTFRYLYSIIMNRLLFIAAMLNTLYQTLI